MLITQLLVRRCPYIATVRSTQQKSNTNSTIRQQIGLVRFRKIRPNSDFLRVLTLDLDASTGSGS